MSVNEKLTLNFILNEDPTPPKTPNKWHQVTFEPANKPWLPNQKEQLLILKLQQKNFETISELIGHSADACRQMYNHMTVLDLGEQDPEDEPYKRISTSSTFKEFSKTLESPEKSN